MRNSSIVLIGGALLVAWACGARPAASPASERDLLAQRQDEFFAALAARDTERAAGLFAEDAVLHVANMPPVRGRAAIRQFYGNLFAFLAASSAAPEAIHVSAGGDMAYGVGTASNQFHGRDGPAEYTGKYALVWRLIDGEWMIALYGVSSNQPEPVR